MNAYFVVALFLAFYYIRSQEESTDIGKNMYTNWNINNASEKTPWCALIGACAVNTANTVYYLLWTCHNIKQITKMEANFS